MTLFDDIERDARPETEEYFPSFQALNRFDWPGAARTRANLESWFRRFPESARARLRSRFRSDDNREHEGALFELFLHELFTRLGCWVKVDPEIADGNKTPDFLVGRRSRRFYLEATAVGNELGPFTLSPNERDVVQKLNTLHSAHLGIRVHMKGTLSRTLGRHKVVQPFERLLADYQPDAVRRLIASRGRSAAPVARIESGNWCLEGRLVPINPDRQSRLSTKPFVRGPWRARYTDSIRPVRDAVKRKAKRYSTLDAPLVVAVNTRDAFYGGRQCDLEVLFGKEQLRYSMASPDAAAEFGRAADGVWSHGKGRRVHAFLRFRRVDIYNLSRASACLYVNPYNSKAVLPDAAFRLPHGEVVDDEMRWTRGEAIADLLGWS